MDYLYRPFNIVLIKATERIEGPYISPGHIPAQGEPNPVGNGWITGWGSTCMCQSFI